MSSDDLARANEIAETLLILLADLGVRAVFLLDTDGGPLQVLHQEPADVLPLCQRVIKEYEVPADRSLQ